MNHVYLYYLKKQFKPFIIQIKLYDYKSNKKKQGKFLFKKFKKNSKKTAWQPSKLQSVHWKDSKFNYSVFERRRDLPINLLLQQGNKQQHKKKIVTSQIKNGIFKVKMRSIKAKKPLVENKTVIKIGFWHARTKVGLIFS